MAKIARTYFQFFIVHRLIVSIILFSEKHADRAYTTVPDMNLFKP
jgi:hypothetical protein